MNISFSQTTSRTAHASVAQTTTTTAQSTASKASVQKPSWNPHRVFSYVEDMGQAFQDYKQKARAYYRADFAAKGTDTAISVDELKEQIKAYFPEYTLTDHEPKLTKGKFYLYIDDSQLRKLAADPTYRAEVFGLMDSELQGTKGYTLNYSDGQNVTQHLTGTVFSLAEKNGHSADGIPYLGSCMSDHPISSSTSHARFRSPAYVYENLTPEKQKAYARKQKHTSNSIRLEEERIQKVNEKNREKRRERKRDLLEDFIEERFDLKA